MESDTSYTDDEIEADLDGQEQFAIRLAEVGDPENDGAFYRLRNAPGGEIHRRHLVQSGKTRTIHGNLINVVHGFADGRPATLVVLQFDFLGSSNGNRRFRTASIDVRFAHGDALVGGDSDPEVLSVSPEGEYQLGNKSTLTIESTIMAGISTKFGVAGMEGIGIDAGLGRTTSIEREYHAKLFGSRRIERRLYGTCNAVRWTLEEDGVAKSGIPSSFRGAILVAQKSTGNFRAELEVKAQVDRRYSLQSRIQHLLGHSVVDPVFFDRSQPLVGPEIQGLNMKNLATCGLKNLCFVKVGGKIIQLD